VPTGPAVPDTVSADQLDPQVRAELRTLPGDLADAVARRLVAAELAEDPEQAYQFTLAARRLAARVGVVREACGIAAYRAGRWADALAELRTARRLTGRAGYLPLMADCERALGRPDRALAIINDPGVGGLDREVQIELRIVESGIRRDEGRFAAAAVALQVPELTDGRLRPWSARLFYAYADALLDAGRAEEARDWFGRAAAADVDGETDAVERFEDLDTVVLQDLAATIDDDTGPAPTTHEREEAGPVAEDADPVGEDGPATEVGPVGEDGPATEDGPVAGHTGPAEEAG
jgi:tetratricopeptide (TPR) repeat protein